MRRIICVNSTLPTRDQLTSDGQSGGFHEWGLRPKTGDVIYAHDLTRFGVVGRSKISGLDIPILFKVLVQLVKGGKSLYLVTQPDLMIALPFLRRLFRSTPMITWAWSKEEVEENARSLAACSHVFCLTQGAVDEMNKRGLGEKASLQLMGGNPSYYQNVGQGEKQYDISFLGLTKRDVAVAEQAAKQAGYSIVSTKTAMKRVPGALADVNLTVADPGTHRDMLAVHRQAKVGWIPLRPGEVEPAGYTNLVESLLTGVPIVISDSSILPEEILTLPGVYRYKAGSAGSLVEQTNAAMAYGEDAANREKIQAVSAQVLNGVALRENVEKLLR